MIARGWEELAGRRAQATVIIPAGIGLRVRLPRTLTRADRELARSVVDTADRINFEQPKLPVWPCHVPPPADGEPDRRPIAWPVASMAALIIAVLVAFWAAAR